MTALVVISLLCIHNNINFHKALKSCTKGTVKSNKLYELDSNRDVLAHRDIWGEKSDDSFIPNIEVTLKNTTNNDITPGNDSYTIETTIPSKNKVESDLQKSSTLKSTLKQESRTKFLKDTHPKENRSDTKLIARIKTNYLSFAQFWSKTTDFNVEAAFNETKTPPPERQWLRGSILQSSIVTKEGNNGEPIIYNTIPKIVNKIYIGKSGSFPSLEEMKKAGEGALEDAHHSWSLRNHNYTIRYFNLDMCRQYLQENYHPIFLRAFDCIEAFSGKVNLFRMLVVYAEGGWYSDWKQKALKDDVLDDLGRDVDFYGVWDYGHSGLVADKCMQNCFFGAVPRHPLLAIMIRMILINVQTEHYEKHALFSSGPCLFGRAYKEYVTKQNPDENRVRLGYYQANYIKNKPDAKKKNGNVVNNTGQELYVMHKAAGSIHNQNWDNGNNYNQLFKEHHYFCEDAKSLFGIAIANVNENRLLV